MRATHALKVARQEALRKVNKLWGAVNAKKINPCAHDGPTETLTYEYVCTNVSCVALFRYVHMCCCACIIRMHLSLI